jgi:hypothetical protein
MVGKKLSLKNMVNNLNIMGSLTEADYTERCIELPDSGLYYFNYLQTKLGIPDLNFNNDQFGIHSLWAPQVII